MVAFCLIALLAHDEYTVRETATAHLPFYITRQAAGRLWREETDNPEKKDRLFSVYRRLTHVAVNRLLPLERPWWPDADAIWRDPVTGDAYDDWEDAKKTIPPGYLSANERNRGPVYHDYRVHTARRLTQMALETGDLFWPAVLILVGHAGEQKWTAGQSNMSAEKLSEYPYLLRQP